MMQIRKVDGQLPAFQFEIGLKRVKIYPLGYTILWESDDFLVNDGMMDGWKAAEIDISYIEIFW